MQDKFSINCSKCLRLAKFLNEVKINYPSYHAKPVPGFGDTSSKLLIIGLAPGMHGANQTGRPFTGDFAGILLYKTLYKYGFSNHEGSVSLNDGLQLIGCSITNAVKCLPPLNRPEPNEIRNCNGYLSTEIKNFKAGGGLILLALGAVAHRSVLMALGLRPKDYPFGHGLIHKLPSKLTLYDSYHCSRYNTQTKRLTIDMFEQVFKQINIDLSLTKK
ncbi:MAG: SPO1 DNA polymerase [Nitrosomonadaceae bacterium]|nr:SPO1 DNA polymerase [Nitrosomonadaceae bacterium]|tara:strand:+ start:17490 stop:18140 length:651 start_codon:yes stop_codon:yes gene_type:complete